MLLSEFRNHFLNSLSVNYAKPEIDSWFKRLIAYYFGWDAAFAALNPNYRLDPAETEKLFLALSDD